MTLVFFLCLILQYWGSVWSVWMFIIQLCSFTLCCVICVFLCVFQPQSVTISVSICISSLGMPECVCVGVCVSLDKSQVRGCLTDHIRQPACRRADWNQNPPQESNNSQSTWGETASIITTVNSSRTCKHDVILTARSHRDHWWYGYTSILNSRLPQTFVFKKKINLNFFFTVLHPDMKLYYTKYTTAPPRVQLLKYRLSPWRGEAICKIFSLIAGSSNTNPLGWQGSGYLSLFLSHNLDGDSTVTSVVWLQNQSWNLCWRSTCKSNLVFRYIRLCSYLFFFFWETVSFKYVWLDCWILNLPEYLSRQV